ncbi:glycoside hydrolase family 44 protein [Cohnella panacarvi]|uniref:glycoside hydrolase family 44 protein n=1 Tax=Cohnella panacarvi TaxID=400776 RepID=UPI00047E4343|nr:glycoside hydrolase family 44 protein [Cohnella panacarvi]
MMLRRGNRTRSKTALILSMALMLLWSVWVTPPRADGKAAGELVVYGDELSGEFVDYGWASADLASTEYFLEGERSIRLTPEEGTALYFYKDRVMSASDYGTLRFWVNGGSTGGQQLKLVLSLGGQPVLEKQLAELVSGGIQAGQWSEVRIPLADHGVTGLIDGLWIWGEGGQSPVYVDGISFLSDGKTNDKEEPTDPEEEPDNEPEDEPQPTGNNDPGNALPIEAIDGVYVYDDGIGGQFTNYGWGTVDFGEQGTVHTGLQAIRFTPSGDAPIYFYSDRIVTDKEFEKLRLWVNGGADGGQRLKLVFLAGGQAVKELTSGELFGAAGVPAGTWTQIELALADLSLPNGLFDGLIIVGEGGEQNSVYLDDIAFVRKYVAPPALLEVRMDKPELVLLQGETNRLDAETLVETGATEFVSEQAEWTSEHPEVARVDGGEIEALSVGITRITATYQGFTAVAYVQVTETEAEDVYTDELADGYRNQSWHDKDLANTEQAHGGERSIKFEPDGWDGVWLVSNESKEASDYYGLEMWIHGGVTGGQRLLLHVYDGDAGIGAVDVADFAEGGSLPAGAWTKVSVNFAELGITEGQFDGMVIQAGTEDDQAAVYIDDVKLLRNIHAGELPEPELPSIAVSVDMDAERKPIDSEIYGINYNDNDETDSTLKFPVQRWGGNNTTRYNWQLDVANRASDWYFMNYPYDNDNPEALPHGSTSDRFIDSVHAQGGNVLLTVPTIGWTPKSRELAFGFSREKYGEQESFAQEHPDAGNGVRPNGDLITGNDPTDTSKRIGPEFVTDWMEHISSRTGNKLHYYALDNEPEIWHVTHRDVHPEAPTYDEIWGFTEKYGSAIKAKDGEAQVFGPTSWGWCAYFYSSADNCADGPDRQAHEGKPFLEWYLEQIKKHEDRTGVRLVDYLDIHYYPQEDVVTSGDESPAGTKRRYQSLKSLYDPNYVDQSWIQEPIRLIPRMKEMINNLMPGMKLAITEYNFGNGDGISAGLAQAEALAIFGREGVDLATRFGVVKAGTPIEDAFKLYLDYDGQGSAIEGESVSTKSAIPDALGAYTIAGADGKTYVLLFNKDSAVREVNVSGEFREAQASVYRFGSSKRLTAGGTADVESDGFSLRMPARSAALVVIQ